MLVGKSSIKIVRKLLKHPDFLVDDRKFEPSLVKDYIHEYDLQPAIHRRE
jgi:hypothetical protein